MLKAEVKIKTLSLSYAENNLCGKVKMGSK